MGRREARGLREVPRRRGGRAPRPVGRCAGGGDEFDARQIVARGDCAVVPGDARCGVDGDAAAGLGRRGVEKGVKARAIRGIAPRKDPALDRRGGCRGHAGVYRGASVCGAGAVGVGRRRGGCRDDRTAVRAVADGGARGAPADALRRARRGRDGGQGVVRGLGVEETRAGDDGALSLVLGAEGEQAAALRRGSGRQAAQGGAAGVHLTKSSSFLTSLSIV
mmetsp:Transcript_7143/g.28090  ORF Transcript_7143/g.28090 Transcript_7143/m.28090 type:complete len:221 (+) Transcript_7143:5529-6191(+)